MDFEDYLPGEYWELSPLILSFDIIREILLSVKSVIPSAKSFLNPLICDKKNPAFARSYNQG